MADPTAAPDAHLLTFQEAVAGRYSVQRELGRGGMGIVYLAREVRLDRPVALKVLPPELAAQPRFRERFLREARTAAQLSHPHIVPVHAVDEVGDFVFFAMAYVAGQTLGERIRTRGPLPPTEAARVLQEVAWALGHAHAQGVVHRDVKPDNILLEADTGRAVVTDFGIAHAASAGAGLTGSAEILGTAEFMSPEQASGEDPDGRSDLYALGVVGHYALSGKLPFRGDTVAATLAQHLTKPAPPLHTAAPEAPAALARAIDRCLAKDRQSRFEDCGAFAAAVGDALERRRMVPAPIRLFLEETQAQPVGMVAASAWGVGVTGIALAGGFVETGAPGLVIGAMGAVGAGVAVTPLAILAHKARRLLRVGHEHDEVVRVLRDEVEERERAIAAAAGPTERSWLDRWPKRISFAGLGTYVAGLTWLGWGPYIDNPLFWSGFWGAMPVAATAFITGGLVTVTRGDRTRKVRGSRWLRFWDSGLGRGIFRTAGLGVRGDDALGPGYRPTAVAIGMAADRLFRELSPALRREFHELPAVVRALEEDADRTRARIADLEDAIGEVGARSGGGVHHAARAPLEEQLGEARTAAEARLAEVVAALESIRLQLIRMRAGIGNADQLTQHLGQARALASDLERLVAAGGEVDRLLAAPAEPVTEKAVTPTPA